MKKLPFVLFVIFGAVLILAGMYAIIRSVAFNKQFYDREYTKLETADNIGMSHEELMSTTGVLIDYMSGKRGDMETFATVKGEYREVFNDREKTHMIDVVRLFKNFDTFMWVSFGAAVPAFVLFLLACKKKRVRTAARLIIISTLTAAALLLLIGAWAAIDFTSFWTAFHKILFTNDLWLFNTHTSIMINMFPEQFFSDFVTWVLLLACIYIGGPFLVACGVRAATKK